MDTKSREKMRGLILASLASSLWSISGILLFLIVIFVEKNQF